MNRHKQPKTLSRRILSLEIMKRVVLLYYICEKENLIKKGLLKKLLGYNANAEMLLLECWHHKWRRVKPVFYYDLIKQAPKYKINHFLIKLPSSQIFFGRCRGLTIYAFFHWQGRLKLSGSFLIYCHQSIKGCSIKKFTA